MTVNQVGLGFNGFINDDTMATASTTNLASASSIKAYVDSVAASGGNVAVGTLFYYGGTSAPAGSLVCDGSAVSRTTYSELFTAIGTTWGVGDGSTTFNLPDLPRRTLVGSGGTGTGELGNAVGDTGGAETSTLTQGNLPVGTAFTAGTVGTHASSNTGAAGFVPSSGSSWGTGSATPVDIIQPSAVALPCIAYQPNAVSSATAASQAEMEAATSNTVFSTPGRQQLHPGHPKAWVVFDGTGTVAIDASYNVTSITDNGTGDYTVNFTTAFADGFYAGMGTCGNEVSQNYASATISYIMGPQAVPTTTAWRFGTGQGAVSAESGVRSDMSNISVAFFGDQ